MMGDAKAILKCLSGITLKGRFPPGGGVSSDIKPETGGHWGELVLDRIQEVFADLASRGSPNRGRCRVARDRRA